MEPKALPKTLGLGDVFCIAVGAMISAGIAVASSSTARMPQVARIPPAT